MQEAAEAIRIMGLDGAGWALGGAAIAYFLAGVGSAIGIGISARVANGVLSEDPAKFGSLLVVSALPGTQGIYGFITAFMILGKLGAASNPIAAPVGIQIFIAALPVAIAGFLSAIYQGMVCAAGSAMIAKQPTEVGKAIVLAALVETYAIFGLIASILLLNQIKV